jgi:hypothetical protein
MRYITASYGHGNRHLDIFRRGCAGEFCGDIAFSVARLDTSNYSEVAKGQYEGSYRLEARQNLDSRDDSKAVVQTSFNGLTREELVALRDAIDAQLKLDEIEASRKAVDALAEEIGFKPWNR